MKKKYIGPSIETDGMDTETIICGSKGVTSNVGMTYGGVDEDGDLDPESRRQVTVWDESDEEE